MVCIMGAKFNMLADVLVQGLDNDEKTVPVDQGEYVVQQDPDSGAIIRVWHPKDADQSTPDIQVMSIPCMVRGVIDGGIRVAGTTERFSSRGNYESVDFAKIEFPPSIVLTKRDRITNVRSARNPDHYLWIEEESTGKATLFDVMGVTPVIDPFGRHVQNNGLLQRSEVQS